MKASSGRLVQNLRVRERLRRGVQMRASSPDPSTSTCLPVKAEVTHQYELHGLLVNSTGCLHHLLEAMMSNSEVFSTTQRAAARSPSPHESGDSAVTGAAVRALCSCWRSQPAHCPRWLEPRCWLPPRANALAASLLPSKTNCGLLGSPHQHRPRHTDWCRPPQWHGKGLSGHNGRHPEGNAYGTCRDLCSCVLNFGCCQGDARG